MHRYQIYIIFLLLTIYISNVVSTKKTTAKHIDLKAPILSDKPHSDRPAFSLSKDGTPRKSNLGKSSHEPSSNPCNGLYLKTNGTTCGLKEIMIGRCYEFQYAKKSASLISQPYIRNCTELYEAFESSVRYKSHCQMNLTTYAKYFDLALSGVHVINRTMFWSGTYYAAHSYSASGHNYITLEDTLAAAMVNGLVWCGKENDAEGFDFVTCPDNCKNNPWADLAFWGLASKTFAQLASGEIFVVLNGSHTNGAPAYRNSSYFSKFELPNLRRTGEFRVTRVNTLVLHSPDQSPVEKCGEKSLVDLESTVRAYGFEYECADDPDELILIMCSEKWEARECKIARQVLRQAWNAKLNGKSKSPRNSFSFATFWCFLLLKIML